jgi:hypothetical protein
MSRYRIEHIPDSRYFHIEAEHPNDPTLVRAFQKLGWSLDDCRFVLLEQNAEPVESLATRP